MLNKIYENIDMGIYLLTLKNRQAKVGYYITL